MNYKIHSQNGGELWHESSKEGQVWNSIEVGKRFHEPIITMTTDEYEVRFLAVY